MKYLFFVFTFFLLFVAPVQAAEIYFGVDNPQMVVGDTFEVGVFLNSEEESINALDSSIVIPTTLSVTEIRDGNSLIPLWLEHPHVDGNRVVFSGVVPGGLKGQKIYLFSVIFKAEQGGEATIITSQEQILLNDGAGTNAKLHQAPLKLSVASTGSVTHFTPPADNVPPEPFQPVVGQSSVQENKLFLAFVAHDKDSGIDHYEFFDSSFKYTPEEVLHKKLSWQTVESPKNIQERDLTKYLYVKAVDRAGNVTVAVVPPQKGMSTYQKVFFYGIIPVILLVLFILFWKRHSQKISKPVAIISKRRKNEK